MRLIDNPLTDPAWNIAADEFYLTRCAEDVAALWRNDRSVIIGKNQNALEEIDLDFVSEHGILVVRRLSGGGAVFHDLGNINFTFVCAYSETAFSDYARFAEPVCGYLRSLGLDAALGGRNDILVGGRKVSGNAQAVRGGRLMSHGTLLYNADLAGMAGTLRVDPGKFASKGVKSVRGRVVNIASLLDAPPPTEDFLAGLLAWFAEHVPDAVPAPLTDAERAEITRIADERYRAWDWNFGAGPRYNLARNERFPFGGVQLRLRVEDGVIAEAHIYGDFFGREDVGRLESALAGVRHEPAAVAAALAAFDPGRCVEGLTAETLAGLCF